MFSCNAGAGPKEDAGIANACHCWDHLPLEGLLTTRFAFASSPLSLLPSWPCTALLCGLLRRISILAGASAEPVQFHTLPAKPCHTCMLQRPSISHIITSRLPLVQEAGVTRRPTKRTPEQRVDLREKCVLGSAPGSLDNRISIVNGPPVAPMNSLPAVTEDGAEGEPLPADSIPHHSFWKSSALVKLVCVFCR